MIHLSTPLKKDALINLKAGDEVFLSGTIYTARDAAHKKLIQLLDDETPLPFGIEDGVIFYVGPTPNKPDEIFGSSGPTTSMRMDVYTPRLLQLGLKGMIGKGYRNDEVKKSIVSNKAIYFGAIGGAGAVISSCVIQSEVIAFEELGPEAIRKLEVKNMPLVVLLDTYGNDQYELGQHEYLNSKNT